jgi:ubiquinone/menaquinone biosynthesis C-methylase UbiE
MFGYGEAFTRKIIDEGSLKPGENVLDCGCGTGTLAIVAKRLVGPKGKVAGVDISADQLKVARQKAQREGLQIDFQEASIDELPFADHSFDVIYSTLMLHHVPQAIRKQAFREWRRVLRKGGRIVVADFGPPAHAWGWLVFSPILLVFFLHSTSRDILSNPLPTQMKTAGLNVTKHAMLKQVIHLIKAT